MISHDQFGKLRLGQFRFDVEIDTLHDWEYMGAVWVGETVGYSEWLRLVDEPTVLRSLAIDFNEFSKPAAAAVFRAIDLPLRAGMRVAELTAVLGDPVGEHRFATNRVTHEFEVAGSSPYNVSCTVLNEGGLSYLVVMRPLPESR